MTKEQFLDKLGADYVIEEDLDAVIATEIAKVQPEKTNKIEITPHTLVEVNRAFRALKQDRNSYIHKVFSDDGVFDAMEEIRKMFDNYFVEQPQESQSATNPIEQAYERGEKIRLKTWQLEFWIQKYDNTRFIDCNGHKKYIKLYNFKTYPNAWELYTEPTKQPAKPFDRDRFERMFRAVVMGSGNPFSGDEIGLTEYALTQLDAYYASKEGGENG